MVWSWSHTQEAYQNAEDNLRQLPRETLEIIFAEWRAAQEKGGVINTFHAGWNQKKYDRALAYAKAMPEDFFEETIVDFIWNKMQEWATCENGGFDAHCCPYGCGCHTVSFSTPEELAEQEDT